jgi:hypothetical protein
MTVYRRGVELKDGRSAWQKLWHFNETCQGFPSRNFAVRHDRPGDNDLCYQCTTRVGS